MYRHFFDVEEASYSYLDESDEQEKFCNALESYTTTFAPTDNNVVWFECSFLNMGFYFQDDLNAADPYVAVEYTIWWESQALDVSGYPNDFLGFVNGNHDQITSDLQSEGLDLQSFGTVEFMYDITTYMKYPDD